MDPTTLIRQQRDAAIALLAERRLQLEAAKADIMAAEAAVAAALAAESQAILRQTEVEREVYALTLLIPKYDDLLDISGVATKSYVDGVIAATMGHFTDKPKPEKKALLDTSVAGFKVEGIATARANDLIQYLIATRQAVTLEDFTDLCQQNPALKGIARSQVGYCLNGLVAWGAVEIEKVVGQRRRLYRISDIVRLRRAHSEFDGIVKRTLQATMAALDASREDAIAIAYTAAPLYLREGERSMVYRWLLVDAKDFASEFGFKVVFRGNDVDVVRSDFVEPSWQPPKDFVLEAI